MADGEEGKKMFSVSRAVNFLFQTVATAIFGAVTPLTFWGLWSLFGSIPKSMGYSRLWLDVIFGAFYLPILVAYIRIAMDEFDNLSYNLNNEELLAPFWQPKLGQPSPHLLALFLIIDFMASIFTSFAIGLTGLVALSIIIAACRGLSRLSLFVYFCGGNFLRSLSGIERKPEDD